MMPITCYIRYHLDLDELEAFSEYARIWMGIIERVGGTHHGYFMPHPDRKLDREGFSFQGLGFAGAKDIAIAVFTFKDWKAYQKYRKEAGKDPQCAKATAIVKTTRCFKSYQRTFLTPVARKKSNARKKSSARKKSKK